MASGIYNRAKANWFNKETDYEADDIYCALLSGSHAFTATDDVWADVSANEITGTGYTISGALLANKAVTQAATTKFDADDTAFTSASFTASHAVLYDFSLAGDDLIISLDFGGAQTVSSGTFTIQWDSDGILDVS